MLTARRLIAATSRTGVTLQRAPFHSSAPAFVQVGDAIPDLEVLAENSPGNKINLAKELRGKELIIGVPAAFSMPHLSTITEVLYDYAYNCALDVIRCSVRSLTQLSLALGQTTINNPALITDRSLMF